MLFWATVAVGIGLVGALFASYYIQASGLLRRSAEPREPRR
jgi:hypothetical protein